MPDGSIRSADANLVSLDRWHAFNDADRRGFLPLCPDLVVELASPTDTIADLRRKMELEATNRTSLGWLLLPESRSVEIWSAVDPADEFARQACPEDTLPRRISAARRQDASPLVPGQLLDLEEIWLPEGRANTTADFMPSWATAKDLSVLLGKPWKTSHR